LKEYTMTVAVATKLNLTARDVSGQRRFRLRDVTTDTTVQELLSKLIQQLGLPTRDAAGAPQAFHAFLERDGRHLRTAESVGDALQNDDEIVLHPDVQAGGTAFA
jgi:hypothetical protein